MPETRYGRNAPASFAVDGAARRRKIQGLLYGPEPSERPLRVTRFAFFRAV
jgi:hypothetical protein